jgi:hypothetical protein
VKARGAASAILGGTLLLLTTGCGFIAPQATQIIYQPSDGTAGTVSGVDLRNVLAISENGEDASIVFTAINSNARGINVTLQYTDADGEKKDERFYAPANASTSFGGVGAGEEQILFENLDATVGGLLPVYAQYGEDPGLELLVPVLDGSLPEYADLVPDVSAE